MADLFEPDVELRWQGKLRMYYGVTEEGLHGEWRQLVEEKGR